MKNPNLNYFIVSTLSEWKKQNLIDALKYLIKTRDYITSHIEPNKLSYVMLDFMLDDGMWDWVDVAMKTDVFSIYDKEACFWAFESLKEIYDKGMVLSNEC